MFSADLRLVQKDEMTVVMGSVTRGRKGIETLLEIFRPPWKNVLDIFYNCWTMFKNFGSPSENSSP